ncbi:hypothetical protein COUCH_15155 [Couchioplanes caeruleus]|uniref:hypothetical protein n=1 Tax=Couchioplanes caeruleus TaxID=56438 RepID=UPI0020BF2514|nr:hypothetical protein [Couchioplanes caeruleus]UQU67521.1 hypothetical protein COUCH_15155 [Couchioplanes caeruleus]
MHNTIPVLASTDLNRTAAFFVAIGFAQQEHSEQYLVLGSGDVELHFAVNNTPAAGQCLVLVTDASAVWKRLRGDDIAGVGDIADREYGLRDFTLVDPDGNQVRIGSPIAHD